jgi:hypothetical protein
LCKTIHDSKEDWDSKLITTLWAYRTTYKVTTCATPFSLVYGIVAILLIKFEIHFLPIAIIERLIESQSLKDRLEQIGRLNEAKQLCAQHIEIMQHRRKVQFDKRHKFQTLVHGMLMMLQNARKLEFLRKFDELWLGPFVIKEVFFNNYVQLQNLDGLNFPTRTNRGCCKEYKV